ncbi:uncharacterized protein TNCV_3128601 [Trichonephila clavipes]|nr:uncharacterized protein TNCV_3128601 [Trichonephila clavipes]
MAAVAEWLRYRTVACFVTATHPLSLATRKVVAKFKPKCEGPYRVLEAKNNNIVIWKAVKRLTVNVDQVRIYRHRKCEETEIGTGSSLSLSDNGSLRNESSVVLTKYNGDQMSRNMNIVIKIDSNVLQKCSRKRPKQDKVAVSTNRYNFRPRCGREVESRPAMERKTQQGGPVRSRKGRGRKDNPYIEERTRSSNRNARRRGDQQREEQERKGVSTRRSLSLEVLIGNANYKS